MQILEVYSNFAAMDGFRVSTALRNARLTLALRNGAHRCSEAEVEKVLQEWLRLANDRLHPRRR